MSGIISPDRERTRRPTGPDYQIWRLQSHQSRPRLTNLFQFRIA